MTRWKDLITTFCRVHFVFSFQLFFSSTDTFRLQRWSPRGHILKSLASKLQVLENCPVLGSRTAVFLESLKFCRSFFIEKLVFFGDFLILFFLRTPEKKFLKTLLLLFFLENTCAYVLALETVCPWKGCLWPRVVFCVLGLEPCALNSTSVSGPFKPNLSPLSHISFYIKIYPVHPWKHNRRCMMRSMHSSVARGGGGGYSPPH